MTKKTNNDVLNDSTFLSQFENGSLSPEHFDHIGHLRIAWLHIEKFGKQEAIKRVCTGIKAYAESLGANDKFHHTITCALVAIMATRISRFQIKTWDSFLNTNPDLVNDALGVLYQYFTKERLHSEKAKQTHIEPDLKKIN